ncbi:hypothetical protein GCM10025862_27160 [Arsenicicoccus piscis]|uniref:Uncharacterized protein n=1 Tax=Arsenicicoccus piscis TaxID=673954 RepID=A0ABQ6HQF0_9MICO|nr:hypothetical protein GCM10025862_27160 [Arsenicicoccus piscis]
MWSTIAATCARVRDVGEGAIGHSLGETTDWRATGGPENVASLGPGSQGQPCSPDRLTLTLP